MSKDRSMIAAGLASICLLFAYLAFWPFPRDGAVHGAIFSIPKLLAVGAMAAGLGAICLLQLRGPRHKPFDAIAWALAATLGAAFVSWCWAGFDLPLGSVWVAGPGAALVIALALRMATAPTDKVRFWVLLALLFAGFTQSAITITEASGVDLLPWRVGPEPIGSLGSRNLLAMALAPSVVATAYLLAGAQRSRAIALLACLIFAECMALTLTRSRVSWIAVAGLLCALPFLTMFRESSLRRRLLSLTPLVIAASAFLVTTAQTWGGLKWNSPVFATSEGRDPYSDSLTRALDFREGSSGRDRLDQLRLTAEFVMESPFLGAGPGGWRKDAPRLSARVWKHEPDFARFFSAPDSDWMRSLAEIGLLGTTLTLASLLLALVAFWRDGRAVTLALGAALCASAIVALGDLALSRAHLALLSGALVGLAPPILWERFTWRPSNRGYQASLLLVATACFVVAFATATRATWGYKRFAHPQTLENMAIANEPFISPIDVAAYFTSESVSIEVCERHGDLIRKALRSLPTDHILNERLYWCAEWFGDKEEAARRRAAVMEYKPSSYVPSFIAEFGQGTP